jgi:hypothetical protein
VVEANQLLRPQGNHGVGAPLIVTELDLGHGRGEQFNDGSNLAANKSLLGHIVQHGYFGKKLHLPHSSIALKNIASNEARSYFAASDDPATPDYGCALVPLQLEIYYVSVAVYVGSSRRGILTHGRVDQCRAKFFRIDSGHLQERFKHSRFMPSARMRRIQAIVSKLFNLDNR